MNIIHWLDHEAFGENKPVVTMMSESVFSKEMRIMLREGQAMKAHQTPFPISIQILMGVIEFEAEGASAVLRMGDFVSLGGGVVHALVAQENAVVRLSIHPKDQAERVSAVAEKA